GLLLPLATDRAWPMTQLAVLEMLPEPVRRAGGLPPQHLGPLLVAAGSLDPPPLPAERAGLAVLCRAIGPRVLVGMLAAKDVRRLGAARLLALTGLPLAELAATVAGRLALTPVAANLLRRAALTQPEERGPYLAALHAIGPDPSELARMVAEVDPGYRQAAVRLAWQVGGQAVVPHLSTLLADSAGPVRMAVVEVLADSGDPAGAAIARERLAVDSSAAV